MAFAYPLSIALTGFISLIALAVALRRLASILHIYVFHRSIVDSERYLRDDNSAYALITGASDGLGKEVAKTMYERGVRPRF